MMVRYGREHFGNFICARLWLIPHVFFGKREPLCPRSCLLHTERGFGLTHFPSDVCKRTTGVFSLNHANASILFPTRRIIYIYQFLINSWFIYFSWIKMKSNLILKSMDSKLADGRLHVLNQVLFWHEAMSCYLTKKSIKKKTKE